MTNALHPYCNKCGWRMGGLDSWDGVACKCGHRRPAYFQVCADCGTEMTCLSVGACFNEQEKRDESRS